jgi:long-chain acyl-CoA synthetase
MSMLSDRHVLGPSVDWVTLPGALLHRARTQPDHTALRRKHQGRWRVHTWRQYAEQAAAVAAGLRDLGVGAGDRVAVHAGNRPEWLIVDLGIQSLGAVTVGIYPTSPAAEVRYLLEHSGARVVIAEDEEQADKSLQHLADLPDLGAIVVIDPRGLDLGAAAVSTYDALESRGRAATPDLLGQLEQDVAQLRPEALATLVYTSGTTGPPKGAMLSHANLVAAAANGEPAFGFTSGDEVLSYLPLCHVAERLVSEVCALATGYVVNFGEDSDTFAQDLREVQPTFFLGVPRVWEKLMATVTISMADAGPVKRWAYRACTSVGRRTAERRWSGRATPLDRVLMTVGWLVVFRALRRRLGLVRCRRALSGAAPISPDVLRYFWSLGVPVAEGYGQTENTAQATMVALDDVCLGTVGRAVPGCELRIDATTGEIQTRGPATFLGYYRDEAATASTIDADGWLHTGDVGELSDDGVLRIVDRMKDVIITAGGKNISPSEIENQLKVSPYVREAVIVGDRRKYLVALVGIELDTVGDWAQKQRIPFTTYADLASRPQVVDLVEQWVAQVNEGLAQVETVKRFALLPKELDSDSGEVTATQKVKRRAVEAQFSDLIEGLYR